MNQKNNKRGQLARKIHNETMQNRRYVRSLRRLGASNHEIAKAIGIKESSPVISDN